MKTPRYSKTILAIDLILTISLLIAGSILIGHEGRKSKLQLLLGMLVGVYAAKRAFFDKEVGPWSEWVLRGALAKFVGLLGLLLAFVCVWFLLALLFR